ncbi:MAG: sigma-70 family RNA polymerase sigma factor [Planctomycetota bacterium]|nr:sigma-70 family RNA polymerase sigma factor [Planctomycetota bacterium]MDP6762543.1 sigma-70 family RNA polymerase sigma factor [Planctomycetota bacterium]MDP6990982.1 sigma-70 family RNA polymerase sigma factor [Planctomycetota bacterium]
MSEWTPDISRLREFDDEEWLRVERAFCGRLMAYVSRRVADAQAREDIVQEAFLGAVRGIDSFDPVYTFEQYLFGICRNRAIDHLRRRNAVGAGQPVDSSESLPGMDDLAVEEDTPSQVVHGTDLADQGHELLVGVLREWVQETWQQGEFKRLCVIEALFALGRRNRDVWEGFGLRDETAVAGIKFRALKRMRELALRRDSTGQLLGAMADATGDAQTRLDLDVARAWREGRVSCPARYWLARRDAGTLEEGPRSFVAFHLEETACSLCQANLDDLGQAREGDLDPLIERMRASTVQYLRSRAHGSADGA